MRPYFFGFILISSAIVLLYPTVGQSNDSVTISANNAVMLDLDSGRVIFEKEPHEKRPIASITKIMTTIVALEHGNLEDVVQTSKRAISTEGSSIYLQENEQMTLEDLLYGLMLRSGNDAAVAIAEHIGGSVEGFVYLMNEKAQYLGMTNTKFNNPHGLDEESHFSTAYDMALLMRYAMQNETFKTISNTKIYHSHNRDYRWYNKNKLLTNLYSYCTGGKTGFTKKAGRTLVSTAEKDQLSFIIVTLNAPNDWNDHIYLYEKYFNKLELVLLERKGTKTFFTDEFTIAGQLDEDILFPLSNEEVSQLKKQTILKEQSEDDQIGKMIYLLEEQPVLEVPLYRARKNHFMTEFNKVIQEIIRLNVNG